MSLDCFGKVIPLAAREDVEACVPFESGIRLFFSDLDPEDVAIINEFGELRRVGVTFRVAAENGESSATSLWLAASEVAGHFSEAERSSASPDYLDAIKATALGGFTWNLLHCKEVKHGALALVDGGVETVLRSSNKECWQHFLRIISKPWDCHDNPLFVW
jgi:hypothetical protein